MGFASLVYNTTGRENTSVGSIALENNTTGSFNTAVGYASLFGSTGSTGYANTAVGVEALYYNSSNNNTGVGFEALYNNTIGANNTALGTFSLYGSTGATGYNNTAVGVEALYYNNSVQNTAVGMQALFNNTFGANNTAVGAYSLYGPTGATGAYNTAVGYSSLNQNSGNYNTAVGYLAGYGVTGIGASSNTYLGYNTGCTGGNYYSSTAIGYNAQITANNQIVLGTSAETVYVPGATGILADGPITAFSFTSTSDYRVKEYVSPLNLEEYSVDQLKPVYFKFKKDGKESIGLIAHELQEYYPFLVEGEKDGEKTQSVNYIGLIGVLIKEVQYLKREVKELKQHKI